MIKIVSFLFASLYLIFYNLALLLKVEIILNYSTKL